MSKRAYLYKPEQPYHMHMDNNGNRWTSAACGKIDTAEIINMFDFEGLYASTPSWCCEGCRAKYDEMADAFFAQTGEK